MSDTRQRQSNRTRKKQQKAEQKRKRKGHAVKHAGRARGMSMSLRIFSLLIVDNGSAESEDTVEASIGVSLQEMVESGGGVSLPTILAVDLKEEQKTARRAPWWCVCDTKECKRRVSS